MKKTLDLKRLKKNARYLYELDSKISANSSPSYMIIAFASTTASSIEKVVGPEKSLWALS